MNINCSGPNKLCKNETDGNYNLKISGKLLKEAFLSCVNGLAYCRYCPEQLQYSKVCDQCLSPADRGK